DVDVRAFVADVESAWDRDWLCEVDKAWDAMHRCLSDGTLRLGRHGGGLLGLAVLGGGQHYEGGEYIVAHVLADPVPAVAEALDSVDKAWLRERYDLIDPQDHQGCWRTRTSSTPGTTCKRCGTSTSAPQRPDAQ